MSLISLIAFQVIALSHILSVRGIPSILPPAPPTAPPSENDTDVDHMRQLYNYEQELKSGYFTGPWTPNTLTTFERVEAVVETCIGSRNVNFYGFLEELGPEYQDRSFIFDSNTYCYRNKEFVRDFRRNESVPLKMSPTVYFRSSDFGESVQNGQGTYPLNTDAVWQIEVPYGHVALIVLTSISLEPAAGGSCENDFVSFYADDEIPQKFCSSLEQIRVFKQKLQSVTIRFQSNHLINQGGFSGGVWMFPESAFDFGKKKRSVAESDPDFMDKLAKDIAFDQYFDDALDCFSHIVKYGAEGAKTYKEGQNSDICKMFSEGFFSNGYSHP